MIIIGKYRNVKRSAKDLVQISDALCEEKGLSVIRNPQKIAVPYDKVKGHSKKNSHRDNLRIKIDTALQHRPDRFDALIQMLEEAGCRIRREVHTILILKDYKDAMRRSAEGDRKALCSPPQRRNPFASY